MPPPPEYRRGLWYCKNAMDGIISVNQKKGVKFHVRSYKKREDGIYLV